MKTENELTPEEMLNDIGLHARSSVVNVEPKTAALWHDLIGDVLCGAAFEAGLRELDLEARVAHVVAYARDVENLACAAAFDAGLAQATAARCSRDMYAKAWEREIGPPYRNKHHHIDAMVMTTEDRMRQLRGLRSALKALVESYQVKETKVSASWLSDAESFDVAASSQYRFPGRGAAWRNALAALKDVSGGP